MKNIMKMSFRLEEMTQKIGSLFMIDEVTKTVMEIIRLSVISISIVFWIRITKRYLLASN